MKIPKDITYIVSALALQSNIAAGELAQSSQDIIKSSISQCGTILDTQFFQAIDRERFCQNVFVKLEQDYNSLTPQEKWNSKILSQILNSNLNIYLSEFITQYPEFYTYIQTKYNKWDKIDYRTMFLNEFGISPHPERVFRVWKKLDLDNNVRLFKEFDYSEINFYQIDDFLWGDDVWATVEGQNILMKNINDSGMIANELGHVFLQKKYNFGPNNTITLEIFETWILGDTILRDLEVHEFMSDVFSLYQNPNDMNRIINLLLQSIKGSDMESHNFVYTSIWSNGWYNYTTQFMKEQLDKIYFNRGLNFFKKIHDLSKQWLKDNNEFTQAIWQDLNEQEKKFIIQAYFNQWNKIIQELDKISQK